MAWYALPGRQAVTASIAVLAVLAPRPLPQLKLPLVPQPYVYAPLLTALVSWSMLTAVDRGEAVAPRSLAEEGDVMSSEPRAISAA